MPQWLSRWASQGWVAVAAASSLWLLPGCGSGEEHKTCNDQGCVICDGFGCRPAPPGSITDAGPSTVDASAPPDATSCDPSVTTCACADSNACPAQLQCINGLCLHPCQYSSECGAGRICVNGLCIVGCNAQTPCPAGYVCGTNGSCQLDPTHPQCSDTQPCSGGLHCVDGLCAGGCTSNAQCAANEICNASTGTCIQDPQPTAPCESDPTICSDAQVCKAGYCRFPCTSSEQCKHIDARIPVCDEGICKSLAEAQPQCLQQQDCPPGKDCVSNSCL